MPRFRIGFPFAIFDEHQISGTEQWHFFKENIVFSAYDNILFALS